MTISGKGRKLSVLEHIDSNNSTRTMKIILYNTSLLLESLCQARKIVYVQQDRVVSKEVVKAIIDATLVEVQVMRQHSTKT